MGIQLHREPASKYFSISRRAARVSQQQQTQRCYRERREETEETHRDMEGWQDTETQGSVRDQQRLSREIQRQ